MKSIEVFQQPVGCGFFGFVLDVFIVLFGFVLFFIMSLKLLWRITTLLRTKALPCYSQCLRGFLTHSVHREITELRNRGAGRDLNKDP